MIVGIGELLWDIYPDGRKVAGGAPFNFAFHCHQLGHPAVIVSRVGNDELGRELRDEVRRLGLSDEYIQTDHEHPTGTVRVKLDENKVPTYTITEDVAWDYLRSDAAVRTMCGVADVVCIGTLARRSSVSADSIRDYFDSAEETYQPLVFCDLNLRPPFASREIVAESLDRCGWLKIAENELDAVGTALGEPTADAELILGILRKKGGLTCLTRGGNGCRIVNEVSDFELPGVAARVVDTVGAGDAFTAAFLCLNQEGRPLRDCARFANHYAARVCEHQGATPRIDRAEVESAAFG